MYQLIQSNAGLSSFSGQTLLFLNIVSLLNKILLYYILSFSVVRQLSRAPVEIRIDFSCEEPNSPSPENHSSLEIQVAVNPSSQITQIKLMAVGILGDLCEVGSGERWLPPEEICRFLFIYLCHPRNGWENLREKSLRRERELLQSGKKVPVHVPVLKYEITHLKRKDVGPYRHHKYGVAIVSSWLLKRKNIFSQAAPLGAFCLGKSPLLGRLPRGRVWSWWSCYSFAWPLFLLERSPPFSRSVLVLVKGLIRL